MIDWCVSSPVSCPISVVFPSFSHSFLSALPRARSPSSAPLLARAFSIYLSLISLHLLPPLPPPLPLSPPSLLLHLRHCGPSPRWQGRFELGGRAPGPRHRVLVRQKTCMTYSWPFRISRDSPLYARLAHPCLLHASSMPHRMLITACLQSDAVLCTVPDACLALLVPLPLLLLLLRVLF